MWTTGHVLDLPHNSIESPPGCAAAPLLLPGSALASQDSLTPSAGLLGLVVSSRLRSVMVMMMVVMMVISHPWKLMMMT